MYDKIYSRPRIKIRIPKVKKIQVGNGKGKGGTDLKKEAKVFQISIILIIAFATAKFVLDAVNPIFDTLCTNRAESIATISANEQATNVMKKHTYDEMFKIEKDANENITMISSNMIAINEIISDVAIEIQNDLNSKGRENISIALRKFYRIKTVSWKRTRNKNQNIINRKC